MKSLLSISSHVVHGYVGNRATVFPLQYTGWDVDAINTTNYSNHPGYGSFRGSKSSPQLVSDLIAGVKNIINFKDYTMILLGYCPDEETLKLVMNEIVSVNTKWIVDPILGDNGKLYVSEKLIPIYKEILRTGRISLITPNQFEFEVLTGLNIKNWNDLAQGVKKFFQSYDVENIVISSVIIEDKSYCIGIKSNALFAVPIKQINCNFNGCGDLFTSLLANEFYNNKYDITPQLISNLLTKLHKILQLTYDFEVENSSVIPKSIKDIKIIAAKEYLLESHAFKTGSDNDIEVKYMNDIF